MRTRKKLVFTTLFALLGAGYFSAFSQLDISLFLKGYVAIIPLQVFALLYVLYLHWSGRLDRANQKESFLETDDWG